MIDQALPVFARLQGTADYIVYSVAAAGTLLFWLVWIRRLRKRPPISDEEAAVLAAKGIEARQTIRSVPKAGIPFGLVGLVLVLTQLRDLKPPSMLFYIGISLVVIASLLRIVGDVVYLKNWRTFQKRDTSR